MGQLQPIGVSTDHGAPDTYQVVFGFRRLQALTTFQDQYGFSDVACVYVPRKGRTREAHRKL